MVEVTAQIIGGPVLLAGDNVEVCITISAPPLDPGTSVQSSEVCEIIAWASAQVHCICVINDAIVKFPSETQATKSAEETVTNSATSFAPWKGEKGHLVLATKPKILFCDLQLMAGQSRSFIYRENLPVDSPPSYRGKLVKYAYKVTVGTQKLGFPISLLRLPLRVIVLQGLAPVTVNSDTEDLAPSNPFLHTPQRDNSTPQTTLHQIQSITSVKNISQYNISHANGHVVTFTVYKSSYRLGEDIVATFDFSKAQVKCVQYSATLQSEEVINKDCLFKENQKPVIVPYTKTHEVCLSFSHTNFLLTTPLTVTPTFSTDIVTLKWSIHFEFVLNIGEESKTLPGENSDGSIENREEDFTWSAPHKLKIETLVWDLPVNICPTSPDQLSQALGFDSSITQIV